MRIHRRSWRSILAHAATAAIMVCTLAAAGQTATGHAPLTFAQGAGKGDTGSSGSCVLGNGIQHIIQIQFDNFHFTLDNPNVPSDLEQMPNLLNFIQGNGTLLTNQGYAPIMTRAAPAR